MVNIIPYDNEYLAALDRVNRHRKALFDLDSLPEIGFIALHNDEFIGAGFLRLVEGGFGQLDSFITNPKSSKELRHLAISKIQNSLIRTAKEAGLKAVYAFTSDKSIIMRAEESGFRVIDQCVITLPLR